MKSFWKKLSWQILRFCNEEFCDILYCIKLDYIGIGNANKKEKNKENIVRKEGEYCEGRRQKENTIINNYNALTTIILIELELLISWYFLEFVQCILLIWSTLPRDILVITLYGLKLLWKKREKKIPMNFLCLCSQEWGANRRILIWEVHTAILFLVFHDFWVPNQHSCAQVLVYRSHVPAQRLRVLCKHFHNFRLL